MESTRRFVIRAVAVLAAALALFWWAGTSWGQVPVESHRPLVLTSYNSDDPVGGRTIEEAWAKFNISMRVPVVRDRLPFFPDSSGLYVAYNQRSWWAYGDSSSGFAETNYNPEVFLEVALPWRYCDQLTVGYEHVSTGEYQDRSQGLDRAYAEARLLYREWTVYVRPWVVLSTEEATGDFRDIQKLWGRDFGGEMLVAYQGFGGRYSLRAARNLWEAEAMLRNEVWAFSPYFAWRDGYDNLVDYRNTDRVSKRVGLAFSPQ